MLKEILVKRIKNIKTVALKKKDMKQKRKIKNK